MLIGPKLASLEADPEVVASRLRARLTRSEALALALSLAVVPLFAWAHSELGTKPFDHLVYTRAATGDLSHYYYGEWLLPLLWLLARLPDPAGFIIWSMAGVVCTFWAARVFGGPAVPTLLGFQMLYASFLGQITGLLVGGLALAWWAVAHRRWNVAGLGLLLAGAKFQLGLPFGLLLLLAADIGWRERARVLIVPAVGVAVAFLLRPSWAADLLARMESIPPYDWASISLHRWLGPVALLLLLPPLALPLGREKRFLALAAACPLALPYFQQADLLALFVLPVGWLPVLLGNLGYLFFRFHFAALQALWVVPLIVYCSVVAPGAYDCARRTWSRRGRRGRPSGNGSLNVATCANKEVEQ